jgi:hypothetical protein
VAGESAIQNRRHMTCAFAEKNRARSLETAARASDIQTIMLVEQEMRTVL